MTAEQVEIIDDSSFRLNFGGPVRFEMDGDVRKSAGPEIEVRCLPAALEVAAPRS